MERDFTYQSGGMVSQKCIREQRLTSLAVEFLLGHNFRMEAPFLEGVPYFSREEEATARSLAYARRDRINVADIFIDQDDVESLEFLRRVRQEIMAWRSRKTVR